MEIRVNAKQYPTLLQRSVKNIDGDSPNPALQIPDNQNDSMLPEVYRSEQGLSTSAHSLQYTPHPGHQECTVMIARPIAIMTDFGARDSYVGVMKGVILNICSICKVIDITHEISPFHVREAAFDLANIWRYFPKDTVFLVVVDPSVGNYRRAIAAQYDDYFFVAPDNGVVSYVPREINDLSAVELSHPQYQLPNISNTFHGRDIFAPTAAFLASGVSLNDLGHPINDLIALPKPTLSINETATRIVAEVMHIDHFGNIITSIGQLNWRE